MAGHSLEQLRASNRRAVTTLLHNAGPLSRADLARGTGLSRTTVSSLVAELIASGQVEETAERGTPYKGGSGRPPLLVALAARPGGATASAIGPRPTLDDVARLAGVSTGTVSRVINNPTLVSSKARQGVERAIKELGYVPNGTARSRTARRAGAVVLAVSSDDPALFANLFFAEVITGINAVIEETELQLLLVLAASERGRARLERILQSRDADGVMLLGLRENDPLSKVAESGGVPVVYGGRPLGWTPQWYVDADNRGGARQAVEYLISQGRRNIGTITGSLDIHAGVSRFLGFQESLALAGLSDAGVANGDFSEASGAAGMARLLDEHPDLDAVFVASDAMAVGALTVLQQRGRDVPGEIAVVGFNDIVTAQHTQPTLTTVRQPIEALGREMTRMLVTLINGERPTPLILPTELVIRDSA